MSLLSFPEWIIAVLIFALRLIDVSLGTIRTIAVVEGRLKLSVFLGFVEVLVWLAAISQVLGAVSDNIWLMVVYSAGFAAGNAVGIIIERRLAMGGVILRIITRNGTETMISSIRDDVRRLTIFDGFEENEPISLLYIICSRRKLASVVKNAREVDPEMFYAAEPIRETNLQLVPNIPHTHGWRTVFKKK